MDPLNEFDKSVDNIRDILNEYMCENDRLHVVNNQLEKQVYDLTEKVDELENTNRDLMDHIDELKMEILEAKKLITESEYQSLNNMYFSVDAENKTVAQEVINNLYNK
jgi:predicted nuclease with TOPRIM domain